MFRPCHRLRESAPITRWEQKNCTVSLIDSTPSGRPQGASFQEGRGPFKIIWRAATAPPSPPDFGHSCMKSWGRPECSLEPHSAVTHTNPSSRQSEAVSAQPRGIMAAPRDKGGLQGSIYLQSRANFQIFFARHTAEGPNGGQMKGMLMLQPNLNV